ncbi:hypothetical protein RND81_06G199000 [Saponaria officinalis]|uniref:Alpha/beta hydrolase fold-3 domain-containing protein n=1 Tax=Saponaria officinalis TaxID=3572 RepID=A0AAW1KBW5_SAPOF
MGSLAKVQVVEDCFGVLKLYNDGSIYRARESEIDFKKYQIDNDNILGDGCRVEWEDCIYDETHRLYLRVYRPWSTSNNVKDGNKMPILYYIHGGGFCLGSRTWPNCHNYCLCLSSQLQVVVIAPDYRLAPEHRLPAAIEDGLKAVKWLQLLAKSKDDEKLSSKLLKNGVDFTKVYIIGDSSGGNIAHHLAVQLGPGSPQLAPVKICGYVLLGPFFGGSSRTESEAYGPPEPALDLDSLDRFWRLSLPVGQNRDHPSANPFGPTSPSLETTRLDPILVVAGGKEIMRDRIKDYATKLEYLGKDITYVQFEGQYHGFHSHNYSSNVSSQLFTLIKSFIFSTKPSY